MIDFSKIEGVVTYDDEGITIKIREIAAEPSPPVEPEPPPAPPQPARWSYPALPADLICGPADVAQLASLLSSVAGRPATLRVTLLDGIYNFPATVYPKLHDCIFTAAHGANVIFNFNTSKNHGFFFTSASAAKSVTFNRIRFTDLGTAASTQGNFQLIKFDAGSFITFVECEFDNSHASGVYSNSGASNLSFFGCIVRDNGFSTQFDHGCYMHSSGDGLLKFDKSFFVNNASHALHCYEGSTSDIELIHNIRVQDSMFLSYGEPQDRPIIFADVTTPTTKVTNCNVNGCLFFNAHPTENPTEKDRNSIKFVNPVDCSFMDNITWNVPLIAPIGVAGGGNQVIPPVSQSLHVRAYSLDDTACRYVVSILNPGMASIVSVLVDAALDMPSGRYAVHSVAAPIGASPDYITYVAGQLIHFDMTRKYSKPQHRADGFDFGTHRGANAFRLIRLPDTFV